MPSACFRSSGPGLEAVNSTTTIILLTLAVYLTVASRRGELGAPDGKSVIQCLREEMPERSGWHVDPSCLQIVGVGVC